MIDEDILPVALAWRIAGHKDAEPVPDDFDQVYVPAAISRVVQLCGPAESIAERAGGLLPKDVTLAAAEICRQLWLADRPGGGRPGGADPVPQGFAIPQRAMTLLEPWREWAVG